MYSSVRSQNAVTTILAIMSYDWNWSSKCVLAREEISKFTVFAFLEKKWCKNCSNYKIQPKTTACVVTKLHLVFFFSVLCMRAHYSGCVFAMTRNVSSHLDRLHLAKYHLRTAWIFLNDSSSSTFEKCAKYRCDVIRHKITFRFFFFGEQDKRKIVFAALCCCPTFMSLSANTETECSICPFRVKGQLIGADF